MTTFKKCKESGSEEEEKRSDDMGKDKESVRNDGSSQ